MPTTRKFSKFPSENRAFGIDWTSRLSNANNGSADTIASSSWVLDSGITEVDDSTSGNKAIVRVNGGTANTQYKLENTITLTDSGYTLVDYITIYVKAEPIS